MIAEGFMPPPTGGRAHAQYGEEHQRAIDRYQRLKALGFPPAAIRRLLQARAGAPFPVASGVTLVVDPELIGVRRDLAPLRSELERLLLELFDGDGA
jgi:DNA-binding transcriptional MerR regulator